MAASCRGLAPAFTRNPSGYVDSWSEQDKQDLELAEKARDFLAGRAGKFIDRARGADVTQLTKQIYLFMEDLGVPARWKSWQNPCARRGNCRLPMKRCGNGMSLPGC